MGREEIKNWLKKRYMLFKQTLIASASQSEDLGSIPFFELDQKIKSWHFKLPFFMFSFKETF